MDDELDANLLQIFCRKPRINIVGEHLPDANNYPPANETRMEILRTYKE